MAGCGIIKVCGLAETVQMASHITDPYMDLVVAVEHHQVLVHMVAVPVGQVLEMEGTNTYLGRRL